MHQFDAFFEDSGRTWSPTRALRPVSLYQLGGRTARNGRRGNDRDNRAKVEEFVAEQPRLGEIVAIVGFCPWGEWTDSVWDQMFGQVMDINLLGVVNVMRPSLSRMIARPRGPGCLFGRPHRWPAGQPALRRREGRGHFHNKMDGCFGRPSRVVVNSVAPGAIATQMITGVEINFDPIPLKRLAKPDEIAKPIFSFIPKQRVTSAAQRWT
jgi:NAD(P)-dependent dehydrogenase (short-subunit alcohol dehydrogenase family)